MFKIADTTICVDDLKRSLGDDRAGALVAFEGWVRNNNEGHVVLQLEYEAYEPLCNSEAQKIFEDARLKFDILDAMCVHRVGVLKVGELAVWVGASAAHRGDAFGACRYIIDEIKSRLPIWKKETYENGDSGWVNCQRCSANNHEHTENNSRHSAILQQPEEKMHRNAVGAGKSARTQIDASSSQTTVDGQEKP